MRTSGGRFLWELIWQFAGPMALVGAALGAAWLLYRRSRFRPPDFWKLAARYPDRAYDWFVSHDGWVVVDFEQRRHRRPGGDQYDGPYILRVPKLGGRRVAIYARRDAVVESQEAFVRFFGGREELEG